MANICLAFFAARPVRRNDYINDGKAMAAYRKEWEHFEQREVWRWETLREWSEVSAEARAEGDEIHLGFLFRPHGRKGVGVPRRRRAKVL